MCPDALRCWFCCMQLLRAISAQGRKPAVDWVCTGASQAPHCAAAGTQHLQRPLMSTLNFLLATVFVTPFCSPQRQNHFKSHTAPEAHVSQSSTLWDHRIWSFHDHLVTQQVYCKLELRTLSFYQFCWRIGE